MSCLDGLVDNFTSDVCARPPVAGLEQIVKLVNVSQIDKGSTVFNVDNTIITSFVMDGTFTPGDAVQLPGFKLSNNVSFTIAEKDNLPNSFVHQFSGVVTEFDAAARLNIRKLNADVRVAVIVENKFKGLNNAIAFEIYGYNSGMSLSADTTRSAVENNGTLQLSLSSVEGEEEPHEPYIWFDTDYATTETAFDAL